MRPTVPEPDLAPVPEPVVGLAAGRRHSVVMRNDGTLTAFGHDGVGECRVSEWRDIVAVAAGNVHSFSNTGKGVRSSRRPRDTCTPWVSRVRDASWLQASGVVVPVRLAPGEMSRTCRPAATTASGFIDRDG